MSRTVIRGARIVTMAPGRPDSEHADLMVDSGRIADIGSGLPGEGAEVVDLPGRIIIPGLVNAHLHTWQTALRSVGADWTLIGYLMNVHVNGADHFTPADLRIGTLAGALNQINCGTTTLGDWCHNNPSPEHTDAAVDGLAASGIRAVFLHGTPKRPADVPHSRSEIERLARGVFSDRCGLLRLGMAISGPHYSDPAVAVFDFRLAAEHELIVSMHQSGGSPTATEGWDAVERAGLFGPRTNIVHGAGLTTERLRRLVDHGVGFTCTPENEMGQGHCHPITGRLLELGAAPSLGTDVESAVSGEVLGAARMALAHQRILDHENHRGVTGAISPVPSITSKQALSWATVEGAKALGLAGEVGHLAVGMRADFVVIDARALNLWPAHDPIATALHASLANIEGVMIDGRWRKREGVLIDVDLDRLRSGLQESGGRILDAIGIRSGVSRRPVECVG
ncbi:amidohydrolase family protein [Nocardia wallacei]|uniref:amidohydrolase family protein n=1 Tax=Nocardia wallacei TaxID=480035 RepID=UPI002458BAD4|nr:amidohydrolase family protein [Nocardia wallacei]